MLVVQPVGDSEHPDPVRVQLEDAPDDGRLRYVDRASDAGGATDVLVPIDLAARDLQRLRLAKHRIVGSLARLLAFHFRSEVGQREHDFVHRALERSLPVVEVKEDADARVSQLLENVARLDLFATQPRLLRHNQHVEGTGLAFESVEKSSQPRPLDELCPTNSIVRVDVFDCHAPALPLGIGTSVIDLTGNGLRVVGDPVLLG